MKMKLVPRHITTAIHTLRSGVAPGLLALSVLLLGGCHERIGTDRVSATAPVAIPDSKVVDYRTASCDSIWFNQESEALSNALYWLRVMDCADRLTKAQARAQARSLSGDGWANAFRQSLLIGNAEPTAAERRQILSRMDGYRMTMPGSLRPLLQLWREQQMLTISLQDERSRYQRLQESTDAQLDTMREGQSRLQHRLEDTTRKLENLTDIERQLSSRKQMQGEMQDSAQGQKGEEHAAAGHEAKSAAGKDEPAGAEPQAPAPAPDADKEH